MPDRFSTFSHRAHRPCGRAPSRNARRLLESDHFRRDNRRRGVKARRVPARDGRTRCKSRSTRRSKRRSARANDFCGFRQKDFAARPRSRCEDWICGCAQFESLLRKRDRVFRRRNSLDAARLLLRFECSLTIRCTTKRSSWCRSVFVFVREWPRCSPSIEGTRGNLPVIPRGVYGRECGENRTPMEIVRIRFNR